ncbi:enoyl-CoA hydratase/isomerase family protein [Pseudonocardiaceae bacterium YIM PH 21723]|nr:enoyl-CoA hydratase/isomerase family protein [Pseudonocardiaceae bacterium YIM PH 21723]
MPNDVLVSTDGALGRITLDRPKAINALTLNMVRAMDSALSVFESDPLVEVVLLDGAGERGLCAGGDIRALYNSAKAGDDVAARFWGEEYHLNLRISRYAKPYVAIMDGLVMGGGVGVSAHGSHRVVTERTSIAMPEVGIGFLPDVGGTYLLSHAPGELGTHAALTTTRLGAADAIAAGLADVYVPSEKIPALIEALRTGDVDTAISSVAEEPPAGTLTQAAEWIDQAYAADTVEQILQNLHASGVPEAATAAKEIESKSPTSLKLTLRALRTSKDLDLAGALNLEYRLAGYVLSQPDFVEGVRAAVIDKDRNPQWNPGSLAEVSAESVEQAFHPNAAFDLCLS